MFQIKFSSSISINGFQYVSNQHIANQYTIKSESCGITLFVMRINKKYSFNILLFINQPLHIIHLFRSLSRNQLTEVPSGIFDNLLNLTSL